MDVAQPPSALRQTWVESRSGEPIVRPLQHLFGADPATLPYCALDGVPGAPDEGVLHRQSVRLVWQAAARGRFAARAAQSMSAVSIFGIRRPP